MVHELFIFEQLALNGNKNIYVFRFILDRPYLHKVYTDIKLDIDSIKFVQNIEGEKYRVYSMVYPVY